MDSHLLSRIRSPMSPEACAGDDDHVSPMGQSVQACRGQQRAAEQVRPLLRGLLARSWPLERFRAPGRSGACDRQLAGSHYYRTAPAVWPPAVARAGRSARRFPTVTVVPWLPPFPCGNTCVTYTTHKKRREGTAFLQHQTSALLAALPPGGQPGRHHWRACDQDKP